MYNLEFSIFRVYSGIEKKNEEKHFFFFCVWEKKKEPMQSKRKEEPHDRVGGQWCCHSVVCKCVFSFLCVALCVFFGMLNLIFDQTFCHFLRRWRVHINSNETLRACRFHCFWKRGRLSSLCRGAETRNWKLKTWFLAICLILTIFEPKVAKAVLKFRQNCFRGEGVFFFQERKKQKGRGLVGGASDATICCIFNVSFLLIKV